MFSKKTEAHLNLLSVLGVSVNTDALRLYLGEGKLCDTHIEDLVRYHLERLQEEAKARREKWNDT